ncbi:hypothetical protein N0V90_007832 [Kalmusia sp. IMI 367209]|nr:hypothetical protein N0V90_007832 [Kalmusia sp. IMI 367209]
MFVQDPALSIGTFLGDVYKVKKRQAEEDDRATLIAKRLRTSAIEIKTAIPVRAESKVEQKKCFPILDLFKRQHGGPPPVTIPAPISPPRRPKLKIRLDFSLNGPTEPLQGTTAAPKAAHPLTEGQVVVPDISANAPPITSTTNVTPPLINLGPRMPLVKASVPTAKIPIDDDKEVPPPAPPAIGLHTPVATLGLMAMGDVSDINDGFNPISGFEDSISSEDAKTSKLLAENATKTSKPSGSNDRDVLDGSRSVSSAGAANHSRGDDASDALAIHHGTPGTSGLPGVANSLATSGTPSASHNATRTASPNAEGNDEDSSESEESPTITSTRSKY